MTALAWLGVLAITIAAIDGVLHQRRTRRHKRQADTYWHGRQQITRHDYDALTRLVAARHPADDPFATTRAEIAALDTTKEKRP